jgi:hypothetical protein
VWPTYLVGGLCIGLAAFALAALWKKRRRLELIRRHLFAADYAAPAAAANEEPLYTSSYSAAAPA